MDKWDTSYSYQAGLDVSLGNRIREIPVWIEASLLIIDFIAQTAPKQHPNEQHTNPTTTENTQQQQQEGTNGNGGGVTNEAESSAYQTLLENLVKCWHVHGLLNEEDANRALSISCKILEYLYNFGEQWNQPKNKGNEEVSAKPDPAAVTHSVIQLLSRLTKEHKFAIEVNLI